jgi:hypothetical protein
MTEPTTSTKVQNNRLRRAAGRQGLSIRRSRTRDPLALGFGQMQVLRGEEVLFTTNDLTDLERWLTQPETRTQYR